MFDEVRDLVQLHYHLNNRQDTEYWKAAREGMTLSDRLRENLKIWKQTTPEALELDSTFLFGSEVYTLLLIAKGFYEDVRLARAPSLDRAAYARYRASTRNALAAQVEGLIGHADFLKTMGEGRSGRTAPAPTFEAANTRINIANQPTKKRKRKGR